MSNQDSGSRLSRLLSATKKSSDDSGFAKKGDDNEPKNTGIAGGGRGRLIQMAKSDENEATPSTSSPAPSAGGGRGKLLQMLQRGSVGESSEQTAQSTAEQSSREKTSQDKSSDDARKAAPALTEAGRGGRGKILAMLQSTAENEPPQQQPSRPTGGRGMILSMLQTQTPAPAPAPSQPPTEAPAAEITSTTDALNQMRLKRREEASASSESKSATKAPPTLHELEAEAAPFEEVLEEVIPEKRGEAGTPKNALTNFIRLDVEKNKGVFEYEVRFEPQAHSNQLRYALLRQLIPVIGQTRTFDGVKLCLPIQLPDRVTQLNTTNPNDESEVTITIIYKGRKKFSECLQLYGILFSNIMKILKFVRFGTKDFDPKEPKVIPQHKLEIWPGYVTAVDECYGGVMLCVDVTHRVLRQTAVLEVLQHAYRSARGNMADFQKNVEQAIVGCVVLTRYNNKTYRIDDIAWDQNPTNTFQTKNGEISYVQYYKTQYNIDIKDLKQPLLISREDKRVSGQKEKVTFTFSIIPEICFLTGLTDEQRADFKVMRDVATYTRISPMQRDNELKAYCNRVNENAETRQLLANWGLQLQPQGLGLQVRQLDEERVIFANNKTFGVGPNADFGKYSTNNELMQVVPLTNWLLIHTKNDQKAARAFMECMERNSRPMGISANKPKIIVLDNDRNETYAQTLRQALNVETQIVVCICPTSRDDRYSAIKKICCAESPIPSQVINARTLSNEAKNRSIVQKIALQMNCKMGGSLWSIKIPLANTMIIGIDSYHDKKSHSVSAFVASTNDTYTRWYSKAVVQNRNEELVHGLVVSFQHALAAFKKFNDKYPQKIIIFRDGVGDGQLKTVKDYELAQLKQACASISEDYKPPFTCVVVQKRVNTRFYVQTGNKVDNPLPGTVLDHTITRRGLQDFYLVPQSVRQGTVTPTHCVVVADENGFKPDVIQKLTYKLCFLYYNWPGTVRVPACCQYAHKLAFLVGQSIQREPAEKLNDRLFYL